MGFLILALVSHCKNFLVLSCKFVTFPTHFINFLQGIYVQFQQSSIYDIQECKSYVLIRCNFLICFQFIVCSLVFSNTNFIKSLRFQGILNMIYFWFEVKFFILQMIRNGAENRPKGWNSRENTKNISLTFPGVPKYVPLLLENLKYISRFYFWRLLCTFTSIILESLFAKVSFSFQ